MNSGGVVWCPRSEDGQRGFLLVEVLIGLALGLMLIAAVTTISQQLWRSARIAADQSELAERGDYAVRLLTAAVGAAWPMWEGTGEVSPCEPPIPGKSRGIRVLQPEQFPCLPRDNLLPGTRLLVLETLQDCLDGVCRGQRLPGWRHEQPGCDPLFMDTAPIIKFHTRLLRGADCAAATRLSVWARQVWYLRDYSVYPGDQAPALMMKNWRDRDRGFGRGEVLVPGMAHWELHSVNIQTTSLESSAVSDLGRSGIATEIHTAGLDFSLTLRGWVKDPLMNSVLSLAGKSRPTAPMLQWSKEKFPLLTLGSLAVSAHLPRAQVPVPAR